MAEERNGTESVDTEIRLGDEEQFVLGGKVADVPLSRVHSGYVVLVRGPEERASDEDMRARSSESSVERGEVGSAASWDTFVVGDAAFCAGDLESSDGQQKEQKTCHKSAHV